jgi:EmrB/QacA subfamily drug resistance transporter
MSSRRQVTFPGWAIYIKVRSKHSMEDQIARDRGRQGWILFSITFASFMCVLDTFIVNISLPSIAHAFNIDTGAVSRVIVVYLLVLTGTIPLFGKLGDRVGFIRVFIAGYLLFSFGSLLCGLSPSLLMLILSRFIQALGGAMLYATGPAMVPRFLPPELRGTAFGTLTMAAALGMTLGVPLGGLITAYLSWHWIFLINVPVGIIATIIALKCFRAKEATADRGYGFDTGGVILSFFGLASLIYALDKGHEIGWTSPLIVALLFAALLLLSLFIVWEKRSRDPLLDLTIFESRTFNFANISNFFGFMVMAGNTFLIPFYLIAFKGLKADRAGLIMMAFSFAMMCVGPLAGRASDRISPRILCTAGMISAIVACIYFSLSLGGEGLYPVLIFLLWIGSSLGLFISPNNNYIMSSVNKERHGTASGVLKTMSNLGSAMGVCVFETLFASYLITGTGAQKVNIHAANMALLPGFQAAYAGGCLICVLALISMALTRDMAGRRGNS